jgi:hypothetical protein
VEAAGVEFEISELRNFMMAGDFWFNALKQRWFPSLLNSPDVLVRPPQLTGFLEG